MTRIKLGQPFVVASFRAIGLIKAGDKVVSAGYGEVKPMFDGNPVLGISLADVGDGELLEVLLFTAVG